MGAMASQITSLTNVYSTVHSGGDQRKHQSSASLAGKSPVTGELSAQMVSNAENVFIWWRHHLCKILENGIFESRYVHCQLIGIPYYLSFSHDRHCYCQGLLWCLAIPSDDACIFGYEFVTMHVAYMHVNSKNCISYNKTLCTRTPSYPCVSGASQIIEKFLTKL